jgi:hypothetical protein
MWKRLDAPLPPVPAVPLPASPRTVLRRIMTAVVPADVSGIPDDVLGNAVVLGFVIAGSAILTPFLQNQGGYMNRFEVAALTLVFGVIAGLDLVPPGLSLIYLGWFLYLTSDKSTFTGAISQVKMTVTGAISQVYTTVTGAISQVYRDTTVTGAMSQVYTTVTGAISQVYNDFQLAAKDSSVSIAHGVEAVFNATVNAATTLSNAAAIVWKEGSIENVSRLMFAVAFLAYAPHLGQGFIKLLELVTSTKVAVQYGQGPGFAAPPAPPVPLPVQHV